MRAHLIALLALAAIVIPSAAQQGTGAPLLPTVLNLSSTPDAPNILQPVTFTASLDTGDSTIPPTGTVQFLLDGVIPLGNVTLAGSQAAVTVTLAGGSHSVSATYSGDSTYLPSTSSIGAYVSKLSDSLTLIASTPSANFGQLVTFTAQISAQAVTGVPVPSGTVQFALGCPCGVFGGFVVQSVIGAAALVQGLASITVSGLTPGALQIVASYSGDANWVTSTSSPIAVSVSKAATTTVWTSLATDPTSGNLVAIATVQSNAPGFPTGNVQVLDAATGAVLATGALAAGGAATAIFSAKTSAIVAAYSGDADFAPSTSAPASFLTVADAAGYGTASVAPDEIVSIFGSGLSSSVQITDSSGTLRTPTLLLASPSQINLVVPTATALGPATVRVIPSSGPLFAKPISITPVAPGLFAANGGGTGPAAAQIIRVNPAGVQTVESVVTLNAAGTQWIAAPIAFGSDSLYLVLYGTGIRNRSSNANVSCLIAGQVLPVLYSGAQGGFAGLDQVNVALPLTLQDAGSVNVFVSVDGQLSNTVTLTFQ